MSVDARCSRCHRTLPVDDEGVLLEDGWTALVEQGQVSSVTCPACVTPLERAEVEVRSATTQYLATPDGLVKVELSELDLD